MMKISVHGQLCRAELAVTGVTQGTVLLLLLWLWLGGAVAEGTQPEQQSLSWLL